MLNKLYDEISKYRKIEVDLQVPLETRILSVIMTSAIVKSGLAGNALKLRH
ncbi:MAG: hypothetical protein M3270_02110 [Thermoproteota archaeon]|nr:hypothetical protein [Thermoproteota archaeon]